VKAAKTKRGRPSVPKKLAKGSLLSVRFSADERRRLDHAARTAGVKVSEWARQILLSSTIKSSDP
jgi:hypothetical protein